MPGAIARAAARDPLKQPEVPGQPRRYGEAVSEPVITRVVAIEELPPGSRATRRLVAA
jgi:hypothetical protein